MRRQGVLRAFSLGLVLFILWLLLSGHTSPLLLGLGLVSVLAVVLIAWRMDLVDPEGHPIHLIWRAIPYWAWLLLEIFKANIDVARAIVRPRMPVRPTVLRIKAGQKSDLGRVIYANSITLTPGTVTLAVEGEMMEVHALTPGAAEDLLNGEMNRRVTAMVGFEDKADKTS
jgi:multicomponent Na+:H+ antiporter subunit E